MNESYPNELKSPDTLTIARELSRQQIEIIRNNEDLGGKEIADRLQALRDAVWPDPQITSHPSTQDKNKIFDDVIKDLDAKGKEQLISSYARMGHLYEIASISARANYINNMHRPEEVPGGIEQLVRENGNKSVEELVEKLNQPVFEVVMTAHPTNVNSIDSMRAQREIDKALESGDQGALTKALTHYQATPLLHQVDGNENLTVRDETNTVLYFLGNLYEDLPKTYSNYDEALTRYSQTKGNAYDATSLQLKTRFGSWGSSGDKDGNNNVTAETTLEAIALHTQAILQHYRDDLENTQHPELQKWKEKFSTALKQIDPLVQEIGQLRADARKSREDPGQLSQRFDELSQQLAGVRNSLDGKEFERDIKKSAATDSNSLALLRRFHTFGFNFAKIEYRETAKEYSRVVGELVAGYNDLTPQQKVEKLTELLQQPDNRAAELFQQHEQEIINSGAGKAYDSKDAKPIAYHTLKRIALARDFGDMIKDNVLAECGQVKGKDPSDAETIAQGTANILEAQFLQRAVEKDGKRAVMGIVPLFEEPDTMAHIDGIMKSAYENKAYQQHLHAVKERDGAEGPTQQVMIAHSDNARRSGLQAARAYIHEAHRKMRELNSARAKEGKEAITTQFFEGGSISDSYRNGVRAISASVNAFGLHDFAKFTFQGGDLLNYFNHPDSTARLLNRQISHQAKSIENIDGRWRYKEPALNGRSPDPEIEGNAVSALKKTLTDYQQHDFTEDTMGILMAALGYHQTVRNSNSGSRAGARTITMAPGSTTTIGAAAVSVGDKFVPVPIKDIRTIGFSKTWQGSGIVPSWIGALDLKTHLDKILPDGSDAKVLNMVYNLSPTFRDSQDRAAFAAALTDMDTAEKIAARGLNGADEATRSKGMSYLQRLRQTYLSAAETSYAAILGKSLHADNMDPEQIRDKLIETFPVLLQKDVRNKTSYRSAILHWQAEAPDLLADPHMGRIAQCAKDTVEHGRWIGASDPTYAKQVAPRSRG